MEAFHCKRPVRIGRGRDRGRIGESPGTATFHSTRWYRPLRSCTAIELCLWCGADVLVATNTDGRKVPFEDSPVAFCRRRPHLLGRDRPCLVVGVASHRTRAFAPDNGRDVDGIRRCRCSCAGHRHGIDHHATGIDHVTGCHRNDGRPRKRTICPQRRGAVNANTALEEVPDEVHAASFR